MFLTLEQVKKHLNLDNDFTEDDVYLTLLTASSEAVVQKHIDDKFENLVDDEGELPAPLLSAMLLFIGNMYAHRESVTNIQMMEVPLAYRYILDCYKNWNPIYDKYKLTLSFTSSSVGDIGVPLTYTTQIIDADGIDVTDYFTIKYYIGTQEYPSGTYTPTTEGDVVVKAKVMNPTAKQGYTVSPALVTHTISIGEERVAFYGYSEVYNDLPTSDEEVKTNGILCNNGFTFSVAEKFPSAKTFWVAVNKNYRGRVLICHEALYIEDYIDLDSYRVYYYSIERGIAQGGDDSAWHFIVPFNEFEGEGSGIAFLGANLTDMTLPSTEAEIEAGIDFTQFTNLSTFPDTGYFNNPKVVWIAVKNGHSATITNSIGSPCLLGTVTVGDYTVHYDKSHSGYSSILNCTIV